MHNGYGYGYAMAMPSVDLLYSLVDVIVPCGHFRGENPVARLRNHKFLKVRNYPLLSCRSQCQSETDSLRHKTEGIIKAIPQDLAGEIIFLPNTKCKWTFIFYIKLYAFRSTISPR